MFSELFQLALSNLGRARARLAMTAGGVVVGTTAVSLLIAMTLGLQQAAEAEIGSSTNSTQIDVYPNSNASGAPSQQLTNAAVAAIRQSPSVRVVIPMLRLQAGALWHDDYSDYGEVWGIDPRLV